MYNHLITGTTSQAILELKLAYERVIAAHGVQVEACHANNLCFNDKNFSELCINAGQQISYCGVGAHHQNALVESKIKETCYGGRTILLHAKHKWPDVIGTILWSYAVQIIVERHNRLALDANGRITLENSPVPPTTSYHLILTPVFALSISLTPRTNLVPSALQNGNLWL